jgi:hypothetical protein
MTIAKKLLIIATFGLLTQIYMHANLPKEWTNVKIESINTDKKIFNNLPPTKPKRIIIAHGLYGNENYCCIEGEEDEDPTDLHSHPFTKEDLLHFGGYYACFGGIILAIAYYFDVPNIPHTPAIAPRRR